MSGVVRLRKAGLDADVVAGVITLGPNLSVGLEVDGSAYIDGQAGGGPVDWTLGYGTYDARYAPLTHASRHATGGADPITPAMIGAAAASDLAGYVPTSRQVIAGAGLTGGGALSGNITINVASHPGTANTVGTLVVEADRVGVALGNTSTTAAPGNHPLGGHPGYLDVTKGGTGLEITAIGRARAVMLDPGGSSTALQRLEAPTGAVRYLSASDTGVISWQTISLSGAVPSVGAGWIGRVLQVNGESTYGWGLRLPNVSGPVGQALVSVGAPGGIIEAQWGDVDWQYIANKPATFAPAAHTHSISEVTGLQTALDGKAAVSHTHTISQVTGLQAALDGKADASTTWQRGTNGPLLGSFSGDLNDATGFHAFYAGTGAANRPLSGNGNIIGFGRVDYTTQMGFLAGDGAFLVRQQIAGVWGAWRQIAEQAWVQAALDGKANLSGATFTGPIQGQADFSWGRGSSSHPAWLQHSAVTDAERGGYGIWLVWNAHKSDSTTWVHDRTTLSSAYRVGVSHHDQGLAFYSGNDGLGAGTVDTWTRVFHVSPNGAGTFAGTLAVNGGQIAISSSSDVPFISFRDANGDSLGILQIRAAAPARLRVEVSQPLEFHTNSVARIRIEANGNVGIGYTSDQGYRLAVNGTGYFSGALAANSLTLTGAISPNDGGTGHKLNSLGRALLWWPGGSPSSMSTLLLPNDTTRNYIIVQNGSLSYAPLDSAALIPTPTGAGRVFQATGTGSGSYTWGVKLPNVSGPVGQPLVAQGAPGGVVSIDYGIVDAQYITGTLAEAWQRGLNGPTLQTFGGNLNDATGFHAVYASSSATNRPPGGNGNIIGFGLANYTTQLAARNDWFYIRQQEAGVWGAWRLVATEGGNITLGTVYATNMHKTSARWLKKDIEDLPLEDARKVLRLRLRRYRWAATDSLDWGWVADEVDPLLRTSAKDAVFVDMINAGTLRIVQDHEERVTAHEERIAALERENAMLRQRLNEMTRSN